MTTPKLTREACAHCRTQSTPTVTLYSADSQTWWCGHCLLVDRDRLLNALEALMREGGSSASKIAARRLARAAIAESRRT